MLVSVVRSVFERLCRIFLKKIFLETFLILLKIKKLKYHAKWHNIRINIAFQIQPDSTITKRRSTIAWTQTMRSHKIKWYVSLLTVTVTLTLFQLINVSLSIINANIIYVSIKIIIRKTKKVQQSPKRFKANYSINCKKW